ncbi:MAG: hypothetical protein ABSH50_07920 [Bryobacteraceae bacterium]
MMRIRMLLPAVLIGAGLFLPVQTPAQAKTSYVHAKNTKYKVKKFKGHKVKRISKQKARHSARS